MVVHPDPRMIAAAPTDALHLLPEVALMVVPRLRTVAADPGLRTAGVAEAERHLMVAVVTPVVEDPAAADMLPAVVEDTPAEVIRMEDATKIDFDSNRAPPSGGAFFLLAESLKFALSVLMAFICGWGQV